MPAWISFPIASYASQGNSYLLGLSSLAVSEDNKITEKCFQVLDDSEKRHYLATSLAGVLKSSVLKKARENLPLANKVGLEELYNLQLISIPSFLQRSTTEKASQERQRELNIRGSSISFGAASISLIKHKGEQPFIIKTSEGEPLAQVNPEDNLGSMHISHQVKHFRRLSSTEKIRAIISDTLSLLTAIDESKNPNNFSDKQQKTLQRAQSATIIGISHLTRLFARKTGFPTWKLDMLPRAFKFLHRLDSQAVSRKFGGTRKVEEEDIEMLVITPDQRQMLTSAI